MKQYLLCLLLLAFASAASAQSTAFTYQGHLMDAGASANGNYDIQFTLKNALSGGATVGTPQSASPVTAVNGIFTVTLDFGSAPFDGSDRWVELGVRPAGSAAAYTVLAPRQRLTATPYALRALNATNLTGTVAAANIGTNAVTSVKINTGAVTTAKIAAGAVMDAQLASGIDAGKITLGTLADAQLSANIPRLNATTNTFTGASGTIGLHTSLDPLSDTTLLGSFTSSTTNGAQLRFGRTGDFVDIGQNGAGAFVIETNNDVPRFALTQAGNLGIGTATPGGLLDLSSSTRINDRIRLTGQEYFQDGVTDT